MYTNVQDSSRVFGLCAKHSSVQKGEKCQWLMRCKTWSQRKVVILHQVSFEADSFLARRFICAGVIIVIALDTPLLRLLSIPNSRRVLVLTSYLFALQSYRKTYFIKCKWRSIVYYIPVHTLAWYKTKWTICWWVNQVNQIATQNIQKGIEQWELNDSLNL